MDLLDAILENTYKPLYAITLLVALIKYPKYYNSPLKFFPVLLMYTFLTETLGYITKNYEQYQISFYTTFVNHNVIIYNIYNLVFFSYFLYVYRSSINNEKYKEHILYGSILFLVVALINPFFQSFKLESQLFTYITGGLLIIYCTILFFLENRNRQESTNYKHTALKWISIGLLIFYSGYIPIRASRYYNYLYRVNEYVHLRRIHLTLICLLYLCFIIGLLRMRRRFWI